MGRLREREEEEGEGCCSSPGNACSCCCRTVFGALGLGFLYIYIVAYIFGESGTPQVLWMTGVAAVCGVVALLVYVVAIFCCAWLGDWPLTIIAGVAAFAVIGGLQLFIGGADPAWPFA